MSNNNTNPNNRERIKPKKDKRREGEVLTERQKLVLECVKMRLPERQALEYLERHGYDVSSATYERDKRKVEQNKLTRLFKIGQIGFENQHLDRIDNTELALKLMWQNYNAERNPFRRVLILEKIVAVQPYLSSFYEVTKRVIESDPKIKEQMEGMKRMEKEAQERFNEVLELRDKPSQQAALLMENLSSYSADNTTEEDKKKEEDNKKEDGIQHIGEQHRQEDKSVSRDTARDRTGREDKTEGTTTEEAEDHYRRTKSKGIFFN